MIKLSARETENYTKNGAQDSFYTSVTAMCDLKVAQSIGYPFLRSPHSDVWEVPKLDANFLTHTDFLPSIEYRGKPCAACFSNFHTSKSGLRRKGYPIKCTPKGLEFAKIFHSQLPHVPTHTAHDQRTQYCRLYWIGNGTYSKVRRSEFAVIRF